MSTNKSYVIYYKDNKRKIKSFKDIYLARAFAKTHTEDSDTGLVGVYFKFDGEYRIVCQYEKGGE